MEGQAGSVYRGWVICKDSISGWAVYPANALETTATVGALKCWPAWSLETLAEAKAFVDNRIANGDEQGGEILKEFLTKAVLELAQKIKSEA